MRLRIYLKIRKYLLLLLVLIIYVILKNHSNERDIANKSKRMNQINLGTLKETTNTVIHTSTDTSLLNVNQNLVVYNRLPKCASTSIRRVMDAMQYKNNFKLQLESWPKIKQVLDKGGQLELAEKWNNLSMEQPTVTIRHLRFTDFKGFGFSKPIYINIVRHPVDLFISNYYFSRHGFVGWGEKKIEMWLGYRTKEDRDTNVDKCMEINAEKCVRSNPIKLIQFFCGHLPNCSVTTEWSFNKAKENLVENYQVVGITEKLNETLQLFEAVLPRYFKGMSATYSFMKRMGRLPNTRTAGKVEPSEETKRKLFSNLEFEIKFYEFVKERFESQLRQHHLVS